jgi:hypothetical protein
MLEENKAIVREFFERWDRDGKMPSDLCATGFKAHIPGQSPMDANAFQEFQAPFAAAFSDWKNTVEDMVGESDRVAFRFTRHANHTAVYMGVPGSGKQISWITIGIARLAGGKIVEFWNSPRPDGYDAANRTYADHVSEVSFIKLKTLQSVWMILYCRGQS